MWTCSDPLFPNVLTLLDVVPAEETKMNLFSSGEYVSRNQSDCRTSHKITFTWTYSSCSPLCSSWLKTKCKKEAVSVDRPLRGGGLLWNKTPLWQTSSGFKDSNFLSSHQEGLRFINRSFSRSAAAVFKWSDVKNFWHRVRQLSTQIPDQWWDRAAELFCHDTELDLNSS